MSYLLDSDIIIDTLKKKGEGVDIFRQIAVEKLTICVITYAEVVYGIRKGDKPEQREKEFRSFLKDFGIKLFPINKEVIEVYLRTRVDLEAKGKKLSDFNLLIGATAIANRLVLATKNLSHFKRIDGLKLV